MTLAAYGDYKYSGDKWLGDVPSHWQILPLKHMAEVDNSGTYGKDPEEGQNLLPVATTAQIDALGNFVTSKMSLRSFTNEDLRRYACSSGDILVVKSSGSAENVISGKAGIVRADTPRFVFSNFLMRLRCNANRCLSPYLYSLIVSHITRERVKQMCSTTTYPNLQVPLYVGAKLPCPPMAEQKKIALFLDHETAKIDALIREQERLIELLQEKRQAVISHAVTKGLDPDVPMKDSGVEWLGEVPAHWVMTRAKMVADVFVPQRNKPELNDSGDGYCWVTMEDMKTGQIEGARNWVSKTAILTAGSKVLDKGAVVASCVGNFGVASLLCIDAVINQQLQAYIPKKVSGLFLRDLITCSKPYFDLVGTAATLVYVNQEGFANLPIPLPPRHEQQAIERYIAQHKVMFDRALLESTKLISILQERRSALISAAVTGKIDVRNWQPPADESAFDGEVRQAGMEVTA